MDIARGESFIFTAGDFRKILDLAERGLQGRVNTNVDIVVDKE